MDTSPDAEAQLLREVERHARRIAHGDSTEGSLSLLTVALQRLDAFREREQASTEIKPRRARLSPGAVAMEIMIYLRDKPEGATVKEIRAGVEAQIWASGVRLAVGESSVGTYLRTHSGQMLDTGVWVNWPSSRFERLGRGRYRLRGPS